MKKVKDQASASLATPNASSTPNSNGPSPKGWIRWSGIIAIGLIVGIVFAVGYVFSSLMLKSKIENLASEAWGAKVEVQTLSLGFDPFGIRIENLAVTDPEQPMQNLLVIDDITITLNLYHLVVKRFVVEDLKVQGLALNVPRQTSGALPVKPLSTEVKKTEEEKAGFAFPSLDLPNSDEILARERFETLELAKSLQDQAQSAEEQWSNIEQRLPTKQTLDSYKVDIDRVFDGSVSNLEDLKQRQEALKRLQSQWVKDRLVLREAQDFVRSQTRDLRQGVNEMLTMPKKDVDRIMQTYTLDEEGLSNITYLLFGESVQQKLDVGLDWYRKATPLIEWVAQYRADQAKSQVVKPERWLGENVAFVEFDPQPKFMVKRIDFDGKLDWGDLVAQVRDVNFDHHLSQKPVSFKFEAQPHSQANALRVEGQATDLEHDSVTTSFTALWQDYQVSDWKMSESSRFPITLSEARNQFSASGQLEGISRLDLKLFFDFQATTFDLSQAESADVARYIAPAFESIDAFKVEAGLKGRLYAPRFSASSDLDQRISAGFKQVFDQELAHLQQELEQKIKQKLAGYQDQLEQRLADYGIDQEKLKQVESNIRDIENYAAQQAKEAEQALRQRIRQEVEKLEREAREKLEQAEQVARQRLADEQAKVQQEIDQAKQQADEEKERLEREAKQKLEQELRQRLRF